MNRRTILAGMATPTALLAMKPKSDLMTIFHEWEQCYQAGHVMDVSEEECSRHAMRMEELKLQMMAIPATTAQEMAAKVIVDTSYGDFTLGDGPNGGVLAESRLLVA